MISMIVISLIDDARGKKTNGLEVDASMFKTTNGFAVGALLIVGILTALYTVFY
jgi:SSS family solute:Na+ symporter